MLLLCDNLGNLMEFNFVSDVFLKIANKNETTIVIQKGFRA